MLVLWGLRKSIQKLQMKIQKKKRSFLKKNDRKNLSFKKVLHSYRNSLFVFLLNIVMAGPSYLNMPVC